jgi:hypothetical protein
LALKSQASHVDFGHGAEARAGRSDATTSIGIREVDPEQVSDWDTRVLLSPGGDVHQTRLWAAHWSKLGWQPRYLLFEDGLPLLSLERPWPLIGGRGAYLPRGPISSGEAPSKTAARLVSAREYLVRHGVDVVSSDAAIPAATGYGELIEQGGFRPIDEIEPSRHRMSVPLPHGTSEQAAWANLAASARQRAGSAERRGLRVVRFEACRSTGSWQGFERPASTTSDAAVFEPVMQRFYSLLDATARRRRFTLAPRPRMVDWTASAIASGMATHLEAVAPDGRVLGAALLYRQGGRLTYAHSSDRDDLRHEFPGVVHLLVWRGIQLAIREGFDEFDLAGADITGHRSEPGPGSPMFGLYAFKRSFGGEWIELSGNHEQVARPGRYLLGRTIRKMFNARRLMQVGR